MKFKAMPNSTWPAEQATLSSYSPVLQAKLYESRHAVITCFSGVAGSTELVFTSFISTTNDCCCSTGN